MENAQRFWLTILNLAVLALALVTTVWLMTRAATFENNALIALFSSVVGALVQQHSSSQGWWFNTSKGTSDTTAVLRDLATSGSAPPAQPKPTEDASP